MPYVLGFGVLRNDSTNNYVLVNTVIKSYNFMLKEMKTCKTRSYHLPLHAWRVLHFKECAFQITMQKPSKQKATCSLNLNLRS